MAGFVPVAVACLALATGIASVSLALTPGGLAAGAGVLEPLGSFGGYGAGGGQLNDPRGVAVDLSAGPSRGDVYVADQLNQRVERFGPSGVFQLAFGRDVNATKVAEAQEGGAVSQAEEDVCAAGSGDACQAGQAGSTGGALHTPLGVAVDPASGDVYVEDFSNHRIDEYSPAGAFLLSFGGEVNATKTAEALAGLPIAPAAENVCRAAEACQAGVTATEGEPGEGTFHRWGVGAVLAVDASGTVYVGDEGEVQELDSAGAYVGRIALPGAGRLTALAVDSVGNVYVKAQLESGVREYDSGGLLLRIFDEGGGSIAGVAVDPAGDVYVLDGGVVLRYDASGAQLAVSQAGLVEESSAIAVNASGTVYVSDFNASGDAEAAEVLLFGSPPTENLPPPAIGAEYAALVHTTGATLAARIDPELLPTTWYVQYGLDASHSLGSAPAPPGASLGQANLQEDPVSVALEGLQPGTTYHYRFVAVSQAGTTYGADRTFATYAAGALALPDGRAWELVSPASKDSAEVAVPGAAGGVADSVIPLQASPDGEAIAYGSFTAFGDALSAPGASQYLSTRGPAGWSTRDVSPPDEEALLADPSRGFSEDLRSGAVVQSDPLLAPGAVTGFQSLYVRDEQTGGFSALTTAAPRVAAGQSYCVAYAGASEGFTHVIFSATGALTSDAPEGAGNSLYEWTEGHVRLVSVLPGGVPAEPNVASGSGAGAVGCQMGDHVVEHAISRDGARIFWTYQPPTGASELLVRENGARSVQIDAPQGGSGAGGEGRFQAASAEGSKVLFSDDEPLTGDAQPGAGQSLYEYDLEGERLSDLTAVAPGQAAGVLGVLGASEDASYVYFAAEGALAPGALPFQPNLYVRHAGVTRLIATLAPADSADWSAQPHHQTARVTPDGLRLAFSSSASLTGYDNADQATGLPDGEVYVYDFQSGALACASCNPSGARPIGPASVPSWHTPYEQPRYLSNGGGRLFFDSFDALAPHDTNAARDVYEWERAGVGGCAALSAGPSGGCVYEISGGTSGDGSFFLDASGDGRDAFISTRQSLEGEDENERFDVYDARVGGGFPAPAGEPPACSGEACRPPSAPASLLAPPASATFSGPGSRHARPHAVRKKSKKRRRKRARGRGRRAHGKARAHGNGRVRAHAKKRAGGARHARRRHARPVARLASAQAGISAFGFALSDAHGEPLTQAGSHPDRLTVSFALRTATGAEGQPVPAGGDVRDIRVSLPAGLVGDPLAVPRCTAQQFNPQPGTSQPPPSACPDASAVGLIEANVEGSELTAPIYDLVPPAGMPAQLGFQILGAPFYIDTHVRGGDWGVDAYAQNVSEAHRIVAATITLWGVPAQSSHDAQRGACLNGGGPLGFCPTGVAPKPFLTLPGSCAGPLSARMLLDTWREPGVWMQASTQLPAPTNCAALDFKPDVSVQPTSATADSPTGLAVKLGLPQSEDPNGLAEAQPRDTLLALPRGLALNPAVAGGLAACSEAQIGFTGSDPQTHAPLFNDAPTSCPPASEIGDVRISAPPLRAPLTGAVYLAQQGDAGPTRGSNPFGSLLALYVLAEGSGVRVKLAGEAHADPLSGQLTVAFADSPQQPFNELELELFGGPRAPLIAPPACGTYTSSIALTPWSAPESGPPAQRADSFSIASGCDGSFAPSFTAGTISNQAGSFAPLVLQVARRDGEQALGSIAVRLPPGLEAAISHVELCPQAQASSGECADASLIGHARVLAGAGPDPLALEGRVYLTGPYEGAPFGLSIVVRALAGPYDLGAVVVRARIEVDPRSAKLTIASDPLPRMLDGVPLALRAIELEIDRPGFALNPTNCNPLVVRGIVTSGQGAAASPWSRFQAAGCASLRFHPALSALTHATHSRKAGAYLHVVLRSGAGQADVRSVRTTLPQRLSVRLSTLRHACPAARFEADPAGCPAGSVVGTGAVRTPLLAVGLTGPAYLVSHGGAGFPELVLVLQGEGVRVDLHGQTSIDRKGIASAAFKGLPDVPIGRFDLVLSQGPHSLLSVTGDLCAHASALTMPVTIAAQNGAAIARRVRIALSGCRRYGG